MFATDSSSTRTVLVLGGTGLMGREVLAALARRGAPARVMVRNPGKLVSRDGLDVRIGDLRDPASLRAAIAGVDVVFHISPHESDEVALTRRVIDACEADGARLVFAGVHVLAENPIAAGSTARCSACSCPATAARSPSARWSSGRPPTRSFSRSATLCRTTS